MPRVVETGDRRLTAGCAYIAIFEKMHVLGKYYYLHFKDERIDAREGK